MTGQQPPRNQPDSPRPTARRRNFMERRREKLAAEIQRNRRGEYTVPTWALAALLVAVVTGLAALAVFG